MREEGRETGREGEGCGRGGEGELGSTLVMAAVLRACTSAASFIFFSWMPLKLTGSSVPTQEPSGLGSKQWVPSESQLILGCIVNNLLVNT